MMNGMVNGDRYNVAGEGSCSIVYNGSRMNLTNVVVASK